jgi:predicted NUDIX family phosphoesterase
MQQKPKKLRDKDLELVFVTKNTPSIHFAKLDEDYLHVDVYNEAWCEEVLEQSAFVERWLAEKDRNIVQIIPYIICTTKDNKTLSYQRKGGGEDRLEGLKSVGIGGHVNLGDKKPKGNSKKTIKDKRSSPNTWDIVIAGAIREATEELYLTKTYVKKNLKQVGTLYTPTHKGDIEVEGPRVGEVHLGIIYTLLIPKDISMRPNEGMINSTLLDKFPKNLNGYELWSKLVLDKLTEIQEL